MSFKEFIEDFELWRKENNYPKREECREFFRNYRDNDNDNKYSWCEYILNQDKPATFLDKLFKKDGEIAKRDKLRIAESEKEKRDYKSEILNSVYGYVKENSYIPNFTVINNMLGFKANKFYPSEQALSKDLRARFKDIGDFLFNEDDFNAEYQERTNNAIKNHKRFFITTAVSGKRVCSKLYESIKTYLSFNDAICLVLPCEDIANRKTVYNWQLSPLLKEDKFYVVYI